MEKKENELVSNLTTAINKIKNKEQQIIFLVADTKGNARASIAVLYRQAMLLKNLGYSPVMLTEEKEYTKVGTWLGSEYDNLPHYSIKENNLKIGPQDFIIIPEIFGSVVEQLEKFPMEKIIFVQSYEYMLDTYAPGASFINYGVEECMTTSDVVANLIKETLMLREVEIVPVGVDSCFSPSLEPQKPIVSIHCRDARKAAKIIKTFYLKYPIYKFITFKDMHGMAEKEFAQNLKETCLAVWIDDDTSFGTFPVEAIKCNVPVVGKVPNILLEWMTDDNGIWLYDENQIVDVIGQFIKNWIEDTVPEKLENVSQTMDNKYTMEQFNQSTLEVYERYFAKRIEKLEAIKSTHKPEEQLAENNG